MTPVVVTGMAGFSSLGDLASTWHKLLNGESGLRLQQPFPQFPLKPLGMLHSAPRSLEQIIPEVVQQTLKDAQLTTPLPDCGIVVGSSRAQQGKLETFASQVSQGGQLAPEASWLSALPYTPATLAAIECGSQSAVLSPMAACATGMGAIARGVQLIREGTCDRVLAGAVEAPITPLTLASFERMGALAQQGCYPFDRRREGLALAEGAALFVLEREDIALEREARIYGEILDFGLTADGYHVSAPQPESLGAIAAVKQCLERSGLEPEEIDYIHAHGTSTRLNDSREAALIQWLFPQGVPVSSTKGATGHTIGASGALGVAFCLLAIRDRQLPPCVGLRDPEFDLDLITHSRAEDCDRALCLSFGFGGQNAAIALSRYPQP
ncbi:beta-ketoacyl-ACP synthase [Phormidium yuhuli AB48]|uniref:Beta-ketoacyl-ACP synthase n=1 Tax=Phormidium yuhuli AB48 TaxID=2940671 RepID=A0ABY5ARC8_9CYAN|nr:beta-ketoacyl-ACP synthase [Phormidium yuhuli]USR91456.1 beta-ketoacyl-ACP synthase [Phormidium yuhuli AB48]